MSNCVVLRFDEGNFRASCIDGFKVKIVKPNITTEDIKQLRDNLREDDYYITAFKLEGDDVLEIEGGLECMPHIESMDDLVSEVKSEENVLSNALYRLQYLNFEISLFVSGLY